MARIIGIIVLLRGGGGGNNSPQFKFTVKLGGKTRTVYDECDGPKTRTTICLKDGYIFLVTNKVVYIALYLIIADFLLMNYFRIFHYIINCLSFK